MKAPNGPLILIVTSVLIMVLCWIVITALSTPTRAIASGGALTVAAGVFIWFAPTNRYAIARGVIALGATSMAAPMAVIQAVTNDALFSMLEADFSRFEADGPTAAQIQELDAAIGTGWTMLGTGTVVALILIIVGGMMHRPPRDADRGTPG